jgi:hypothetical protein
VRPRPNLHPLAFYTINVTSPRVSTGQERRSLPWANDCSSFSLKPAMQQGYGCDIICGGSGPVHAQHRILTSLYSKLEDIMNLALWNLLRLFTNDG